MSKTNLVSGAPFMSGERERERERERGGGGGEGDGGTVGEREIIIPYLVFLAIFLGFSSAVVAVGVDLARFRVHCNPNYVMCAHKTTTLHWIIGALRLTSPKTYHHHPIHKKTPKTTTNPPPKKKKKKKKIIIIIKLNKTTRNNNSTFFTGRKEGNGLFNDALNTFYWRLYGVRHMVKDHSDSERGNPLAPHRLFFPISNKGSFICTIQQTG